MSKLGKFFKRGGSSRSRAAPSPQEVLARLRETEEMLGKKQEYLENRIHRELSLARRHGTHNKPGRLAGCLARRPLPRGAPARVHGLTALETAPCAPPAFLGAGPGLGPPLPEGRLIEMNSTVGNI